MNVSVMVVLSTTYVLVPVEVTVVLALVEVVVVEAAAVVDEAAADEVEDSTRGVQLGRVKVGEFPDPPSTMQFFAQAAVPLVASG